MKQAGPGEAVIVEGHWAVEALLASRFTVREVVVESGRHPDILPLCQEKEVPVRELGRAEIARLAGYPFHRGIYAVAERPPSREPDAVFLETATRLLVPMDISDPGNLGTLIRTAAAFGMDGILVEAGRGCDVYARKCIRASARAVFRLPVFEVRSLGATFDRLEESGFLLFGGSLGEGSRPVQQVRSARKTALLLGSEGEGLSAEMAGRCAELVRLPMQAGMDSLNVAVAGAVWMWEWFGRAGDTPD